MRIQHNITAMNSYRTYAANTSRVAKNLEKLSSGYRINRAGDDAAGLAISEKMRVQITGLEQAQSNAKSGISLVQTAEGALTEVHDMLNRMYTLAEQSANGTYADELDREQLQKEVGALRTEIDRIADSTNYNGINLLDGSMSSSTDLTKKVDFSSVLPAAGKMLGSDTVLHSTAANNSQGTTFSVDLHNTSFANELGQTLTIKIGSNTLTLEGDASGALDSNAIVQKLVSNSGGHVEINDQTFDIAAGTTGQGDARLTFTQASVPTSAAQEVNGAMAVRITGDGVGGALPAGSDAYIFGTAATGVTYGGGTVKASYSGLDKDAILAKINELVEAGETEDGTALTADDVNGNEILLVHDNNKIVARVSGSYSNNLFTLTDTTAEVNKLAVANGTTANSNTIDLGDYGEMVLSWESPTTSATTTANLDTTTGATGLKFNDGSYGIPGTITTPAITMNGNGATGVAEIGSMDLAGLTLTTASKLIFTVGGKDFEVEFTDDDITGATAIPNLAAERLAQKLNNQFTDSVSGKFSATANGTQIDLLAENNGVMANTTLFGSNVSVRVADKNAAGTSSVADYNMSTTDVVNVTSDTSGNRLASTYFNLDRSMIEDGASLRIGDTKYVFTKANDKVDSANTKYVKIGDLNTKDATYASQVAKRLTDVAAGNATWTVGHDGTRMTFTEIRGQQNWDLSKLEGNLATNTGIVQSFGYTGADKRGSDLTLQIGDTAEGFNQLSVSVKDMHSAAMGIGDVDISTQDGAAKAMNAIKTAVNYVSDTRGTLGALQNRLDHTINNLGVMQENIQDAESVIRDTDIAKEMMAYTKNNILVQSAQAMLAQANQLPQGVLQLLQ